MEMFASAQTELVLLMPHMIGIGDRLGEGILHAESEARHIAL